MKNPRFRRILSLATATALTLGMSLSSYAADAQLTRGEMAQLLVEKEGPLFVNGPNDIEPHLVYVDVRPGAEEAFLAAITANMRTAVEVEPGVLVMYAATMADQPTRWVFWEVYASAEAYAAHRETQHFKQYLAATEDIVVGKEFHVLAADTLVSKGSLGWSPR